MTATERLAEIKARAEAATEGPWEYREEILGLPNTTVMAGNEQVGYVAVGHFLSGNANFIAASRTDVPRLVAALEAVLELHRPREIQVMTGEDCLSDECGHPDMDDCPVGPFDRCAGCVGYTAHPCPTVTVINEALGEETQ